MKHFSDQQIQQAIEALNREFPEVWERMKDVMRNPFRDNDEKISYGLRAMHLTFGRLSFVERAVDRERAMLEIVRDVSAVAAADISKRASEAQ